MPRTPEVNRPYMKAYYEANKPVLLAKQGEYAKARLVGPDGDHVRSLRRARVNRHYALHSGERLADQRSQLMKLKAEMIVAYGGACACCSESAPAFLTIDHINRDGAAHRRALSPSQPRGANTKQVYMDLKRRGWPKNGYRLFCMNCNFATRNGLPCPHEQTVTEWPTEWPITVGC